MALQDTRKDKIIRIDRDSYFDQYAWALENFDLRAVFNDFLETEKGITDEKAREKLWEDYKKRNEDGEITDLQVDILQYVMKYELGVYKKGEDVAQVYGQGSGEIQLLEPGYYFIQVNGASGLSCQAPVNQAQNGIRGEVGDPFKNRSVLYTDTENEPSCKLYISDKLDFFFEVHDGDYWKYTRGYVELNQNFIFFYQIGKTDVATRSYDDQLQEANYALSTARSEQERALIREQYNIFKKYAFADRTGEEPLVMWDFAEFNSDPLSEDFYSLHLVVNKITLKPDQIWRVGVKKLLCGLDSANIKPGYYANLIAGNLQLQSGKMITYSSVLDADNTFNCFNYNRLHGGDGGSVSTVIYIPEPTNLSYFNDNTGTAIFGYCDGGDIVLYAEAGLTSNGSTYIPRALNSRVSIPITGLPAQVLNSDFVDVSSKDFSQPCDFHVGEQFHPHTFAAGAGRGLLSRKGQLVYACYGGGSLGEGTRLNEFQNAYYQVARNGSIEIKYLCSKYARKFASSGFTTDGDTRPLFYVADGYIPIGETLPIKVWTNSFVGAFTGIPVPEALSNRQRTLNYLSFDFDTTKVSEKGASLAFTGYSQNRQYVRLSEDKPHFSLSSPAIKSALFDPLIGQEALDTLRLDLKMTDSICFLNYLEFAYNSAAAPRLTIDISEFNSTSYELILSVRGFNGCNFRFLNVFEEIIQLSFEYKNDIQLNDYYDMFSQRVLEAVDAKIESLEYSLVDPKFDQFKPYVEGYAFIVPKYTKLYLRFNFNTSRVLIDRDISTFYGATTYYKKNVKFDGSVVLDSYFNHGSKQNFQCIAFIPNTSQDVQVYIKRYTFTLNMQPDLYSNITVKNLSGKLEFEVGEGVYLSFDLKNYERVSHLLNKCTYIDGEKPKLNGDKLVTCYSYFDQIHKFESYFEFFDDGFAQPKEFNMIDGRVQSFLSRKGAHRVGMVEGSPWPVPADEQARRLLSEGNQYEFGYNPDGGTVYATADGRLLPTVETSAYVGSSRGLVVQTSRIFNSDGAYDSQCAAQMQTNEFAPIALHSRNQLPLESIVLVFYFKECDIGLRISSDYLSGQLLAAAEGGGSESFSIFKNYSFFIYGAGGPTGNGEDGGDGENHPDESRGGGWGGDGYIGGIGGSGGSTSNWGPKVILWHDVLPKDIGIYLRVGGPGGPGGKGFTSAGRMGACGAGPIGAVYFKYDDSMDRNGNPGLSGLYCGAQGGGLFKLSKKKDDFVKTSITISSGTQGVSLKKAGPMKSGRGGGCGTVSSLKLNGDNSGLVYISAAALRESPDPGHYTSSLSVLKFCGGEDPNNIKTIAFMPGLPGACRGTATPDKSAEATHWLWKLTKWKVVKKGVYDFGTGAVIDGGEQNGIGSDGS